MIDNARKQGKLTLNMILRLEKDIKSFSPENDYQFELFGDYLLKLWRELRKELKDKKKKDEKKKQCGLCLDEVTESEAPCDEGHKHTCKCVKEWKVYVNQMITHGEYTQAALEVKKVKKKGLLSSEMLGSIWSTANSKDDGQSSQNLLRFSSKHIKR